MIQELDNNRKIRQCNWVRFLVGTECQVENCLATAHSNTCSGPHATEDGAKHNESMEPNMTASIMDGQPVFEVITSILPHTLIVVHFKDIIPSTSCEGLLAYNGIPVAQKYAPPNTAELQGNCGISIYIVHPFHVVSSKSSGTGVIS
jgi:hypothetical protein